MNLTDVSGVLAGHWTHDTGTIVARMATGGMARALSPAFSPFDGDTVGVSEPPPTSMRGCGRDSRDGLRDMLPSATGGFMESGWLGDLQVLLRERQLDLDAVLHRLVDEATRVLDADRGTIFLVDQARGELVSRVAHLPEMTEIRLAIGEGVAGWVARSGRLVNMARGADDHRFSGRIDELTGYHTDSLLAAPVRNAEGATVAVLQLLNKRGSNFDRDDEARISEVAAGVARVLDQSSLRSQLNASEPRALSFRYNHIIGDSLVMQAVYDRTGRAARTEATVLIRGESGAGKELVARAVHYNSKRAEGPLVVVDLSALPSDLIENELFGHVRGAYTGAASDHPGKVAAAEGGTIFLDEVGEIPLPLQSRLLRLVQERTYFPVGGTEVRAADVRFVCATHRNLEEMVADGRFRQDLYYRLRVVEINLPPLRERGSADLDRLVDHFLYEYCRRHDRPGLRLSVAARQRLHAHGWPGNVRELQHCVESAVVMAEGDEITVDALPIGAPLRPVTAAPVVAAPNGDLFSSGVRSLHDVERDYVRFVLDACGSNRSEAARRLGIGRNTLLRKLG